MERDKIVAKIDSFLAAWQEGNRTAIQEQFTADAVFESSAHGLYSSNIEISEELVNKLPADSSLLFSSNHYVAHIPDTCRYVVTFYVYGIVRRTHTDALVFGATATGHIKATEARLHFTDIKFSVNWLEGNTSLLSGWKQPRGNRYWQPGDPEKVIVSELDAPWHLYRNLTEPGSEEELVKQSYARYSWAIDQADFTLLGQQFSADAYGNFTPMGELSGKHQIIATMKEFRQPWPWMQHFGEGLKVDFNPDKTQATLIVGRLIPQQYLTVLDARKYGAHYQLKMIKTDNTWKIKYFSYNPGWFSDLAEIL